MGGRGSGGRREPGGGGGGMAGRGDPTVLCTNGNLEFAIGILFSLPIESRVGWTMVLLLEADRHCLRIERKRRVKDRLSD